MIVQAAALVWAGRGAAPRVMDHAVAGAFNESTEQSDLCVTVEVHLALDRRQVVGFPNRIDDLGISGDQGRNWIADTRINNSTL